MGHNSQEYFVYVGTYTTGKSKGIYIYRLDTSSGILRFSGAVEGVENPSFLAIHPGRRFLYAVNELTEFEGKASGALSAFSIDGESGHLTFLNKRPTMGSAPCYVSVDTTGSYVFVANYFGGSVIVFPVQEDGGLGEPTDFVQHQGSGTNPERQEGPHAHSILPDSSNRFVFVCDLGLDKIMIYRFDAGNGRLNPNDIPWAQVHAGAGPRHLEFHPNGRFAYVINELDSTITAFQYCGEQGRLTEVQTVSTLPEGFAGANSCADIHLHPSGEFLYGSNRGHNSIVIFRVDQDTGALSYVGHESTRGKMPRHFALDPTGEFLMAENHHSDTIVTFRINRVTGRLQPTGHVVEVPSPVCLKMITELPQNE